MFLRKYLTFENWMLQISKSRYVALLKRTKTHPQQQLKNNYPDTVHADLSKETSLVSWAWTQCRDFPMKSKQELSSPPQGTAKEQALSDW